MGLQPTGRANNRAVRLKLLGFCRGYMADALNNETANQWFRNLSISQICGGMSKAVAVGVSSASLFCASLAMANDAGKSNDGAGTAASSAEAADAQFRALFQTWKKADMSDHSVISVPSMQPVDALKFSSRFGTRSDPFRGTAAMHAGVDIPGKIGTPIYATADGVVSFSGRRGAYGNLVQINHGRGLETRYAHLSKLLVAENSRVRRGQMIGLMGSTGRSTGSHLHYEVRVDGSAVNPIPFLQDGEYAQVQDANQAVGGPAE